MASTRPRDDVAYRTGSAAWRGIPWPRQPRCSRGPWPRCAPCTHLSYIHRSCVFSHFPLIWRCFCGFHFYSDPLHNIFTIPSHPRHATPSADAPPPPPPRPLYIIPQAEDEAPPTEADEMRAEGAEEAVEPVPLPPGQPAPPPRCVRLFSCFLCRATVTIIKVKVGYDIWFFERL